MWAGPRHPFAYAVAPRRPYRRLGSFRTGGRTDKETPRSGLCRSPNRSRRRTRRISDPLAAHPHAARLAESAIGEADPVSLDELCRRGLVGVYHCGRAPYYSVGTASGSTARAALAQSTSFCTVGAPLRPIATTTSPFTLMGNPPPHAATRASVGMPAKSDGSPWIKLKRSCVETPNRAVYALFCAISTQRIGAPSIRPKALRLPPSSRIATFSATPIFLAFATASSTIFCASSEEMLCFFTTSAIGLPPLICIAR